MTNKTYPLLQWHCLSNIDVKVTSLEKKLQFNIFYLKKTGILVTVSNFENHEASDLSYRFIDKSCFAIKDNILTVNAV